MTELAYILWPATVALLGLSGVGAWMWNQKGDREHRARQHNHFREMDSLHTVNNELKTQLDALQDIVSTQSDMLRKLGDIQASHAQQLDLLNDR